MRGSTTGRRGARSRLAARASATTARPVTIAPSSKRRSTCSTRSAVSSTTATCQARRLPRARPRAVTTSAARAARRAPSRAPCTCAASSAATSERRCSGNIASTRREQRDAGDEPREHDARARRAAGPRAAEQRAGDAGERRRDHDRLLRGGGVERLVRRDLADDEDRDAVQRVEPAADGERRAGARRSAARRAPSAREAEQHGGDSPDGEEDERCETLP